MKSVEMGGFKCPHCKNTNLCTCKTCKKFYEDNGTEGRKYAVWTNDGNGIVCQYCDKVFSLDESLEADYEDYRKVINEKSVSIEIVKHYLVSDPDFTGDCTVDLIVDGEYVYKEEDWYHDKVEHKIEGYLDALKQQGISYTVKKTPVNDSEW